MIMMRRVQWEHQGEESRGSLHTSDYMLNQVLNDEHTEEGKGSLGPGRKNRRYKSTDVWQRIVVFEETPNSSVP